MRIAFGVLSKEAAASVVVWPSITVNQNASQVDSSNSSSIRSTSCHSSLRCFSTSGLSDTDDSPRSGTASNRLTRRAPFHVRLPLLGPTKVRDFGAGNSAEPSAKRPFGAVLLKRRQVGRDLGQHTLGDVAGIRGIQPTTDRLARSTARRAPATLPLASVSRHSRDRTRSNSNRQRYFVLAPKRTCSSSWCRSRYGDNHRRIAPAIRPAYRPPRSLATEKMFPSSEMRRRSFIGEAVAYWGSLLPEPRLPVRRAASLR